MAVSPSMAIYSNTDRRARVRALASARERVLAGAAPPATLRKVIRRSWSRCTSAGVEAVRDTAPLACSAEEAADRWARSPLALTEPVLRQMLADVDPADRQLVIVTDAEGVMLWLDGAPVALEAGHAVGARLGALWSEEAVGTNAMGTALVEKHSVQIFSAEHLSSRADTWVCSAAPVRDPETGEQLGVIDLSGEMSTAHPHSLALAGAAAHAVEGMLAHNAAVAHARLRENWGGQVGGGRAAALVSATGTIVLATRDAWVGRRIEVPAEGGAVHLEEGSVIVEPVKGGFLLWSESDSAASSAAPPLPLRATALGRDRVELSLDGETIELSRRHSEILVLLALRPEGLTDQQIAIELYGDFGKPVTARAELSRLRRVVGCHITAAPYRLSGEMQGDFLELEALVLDGRMEEALTRYCGPLLPRSEVPVVVEKREQLDHLLRSRVLCSGDAGLLQRWNELPSGRDDLGACRAFVALLDASDPRWPGALSRLRRLGGPDDGR